MTTKKFIYEWKEKVKYVERTSKASSPSRGSGVAGEE